jgi:3-carboxy-cis,cis-muconate cycloisomerase
LISEADVGLLSPGWAGSAAEVATSDEAFLQAMLDAEAALVRALASLGHAPAAAAAAVTAAARCDRLDVRSVALRARTTGNPVIPLIEDLTAVAGPDAAGHIHRGATSQDILDTAAMLVASRVIALTVADLDQTAAVLAALARHHRDTPMAARTLTQHAVPTVFGLKAAGWRSLVLDARDRLHALRLPAQLGGAAGTLAGFGEAIEPSALPLIAAFARETGLAQPVLPWHTLRTPIGDLAGAMAFTAGALGKLAADVLVLARTEIGEIDEGEGGGSSAMPHKNNPVRATLVAAAARQVPPLAAILYQSMAAEDERPSGAWHAEWQSLRTALRLTGGATALAAALVTGLTVRPDRMRANLDLTAGLIVSERLVAHLGRARTTQLARDGGLTTAVNAEQLDPTTYLGAAGELTERALEERT